MAKEVDTSSLQFVQATSFSKLPFFQLCWDFNRYTYIYTLQHPQHVLGLHQHIKTVCPLFGDKANWAYYDTEFRKLVAQE